MISRRICLFTLFCFAFISIESPIWAKPKGLIGEDHNRAPRWEEEKSITAGVSGDEKDRAKNLLDRFQKNPERVSIPDEVSFGDTVTAKILNRYNAPLLDKEKYREIWDYCNLIALALGQVNPLRPRLKFDSGYVPEPPDGASSDDMVLWDNIGYHVGIIDSDEIGGCSAPGGYILITKGLLLDCKSEAELAGVIAHEMAHISRSHGLYIIKQAMDSSERRKLLVNTLVKAYAQTGKKGAKILGGICKKAALAVNLYSKFSYGKRKEFEADEIAAELCYRLGYDPYAFVSFIRRLKLRDNKAYSSHPKAEAREDRLNRYIRENCPGATDGQRNTLRYFRTVLNCL